MKRSVRRRIFFLFLLTAFGFLNYPFLSQQINRKNEITMISSYDSEIDGISEEKLEELLREAKEYNEALRRSGAGLQDAFSDDRSADERYESLLNTDGSGMMGYLEIPDIGVRLPIYHGVSVQVLEKGAGHLYGSSLPVGGEGSHAVLSSHRGLVSRELFTNLDQVKTGDIFKLYVLNEKMAYRVDDIRTVKPEETDSLGIRDGEDRVTLVTCTPYGVNSHRLLVSGVRIPWEEADETEERASAGMSLRLEYVFGVSLMILIAAGIVLLIPRRDRKEERAREKR